MGADACTDANIGSIYLGCRSAKSCNKAGNNGGFCNLDLSCSGASSDRGYIGSIVNRCNEGNEACYKSYHVAISLERRIFTTKLKLIKNCLLFGN